MSRIVGLKPRCEFFCPVCVSSSLSVGPYRWFDFNNSFTTRILPPIQLTLSLFFSGLQSCAFFFFFVGFLQVLIIDEVSMIGGELLEKLDNVAQLVKNKQQPFGGLSLTLSPFPPSFALSFSRLRLFSNSISHAHALTHANTHTQ